MLPDFWQISAGVVFSTGAMIAGAIGHPLAADNRLGTLTGGRHWFVVMLAFPYCHMNVALGKRAGLDLILGIISRPSAIFMLWALFASGVISAERARHSE
jgi:hypothetical protein